MFDTRPALADMASQIRTCRASDGLTLQQLASRSGVAASTIHKVESQQMVPTVSVLLKIAKGLGRRPEELIRDGITGGDLPVSPPESTSASPSPPDMPPDTPRSNDEPSRAGVWRINLLPTQSLPRLALDPDQRAIVLVERGEVQLVTGDRRIELSAGDCVEIEGGRSIASAVPQTNAASLTLIVTPPGEIERRLGSTNELQPSLS